MFLRLLSQRALWTTVFVFCILIFLASHQLYSHLASPNTSSFLGTSTYNPPFEVIQSDQSCNDLPASNDILVIIKTGANEIHDKLPTQLLTALRCYTDILIFSDLEQYIGSFEVHDALKNVLNTTKDNSSDFSYYRQLQDYKKNDQDITKLRKTSGSAAWNLDKYKFLHMLEETWEMRPHRKWYIFIEADTYLVRTNLLLWLERQDSSRLIYYGSPTSVNDETFAHGGSGVILSGAALSRFAENDQGVAARYDNMLQNEDYGDYVLTKALQDKGIALSSRWPMLQAEKPSTIPFGPGPDSGARHWCQPIVTMHHITPEEVGALWRFEQQRKHPKEPLLIKELYQNMIKPKIYAEREDWYNLSDDVMYRPPGVNGDRQKSHEDMTTLEREAHVSFEHCGRACEEHPRCFQYSYSNQECGFSYSYRLGRKRDPEPGTTFKSGWNLARIARDETKHHCYWPRWL